MAKNHWAGEGGYLLLKEKDGVLSGYSVVEVPLAKNPKSYRTFMKMFPLSGTSKKVSDEKIKFEFVVTAEDGSKTRTKGTYNTVLAEIQAESHSTVKISNPKTKKEKLTAVSYKWTAR